MIEPSNKTLASLLVVLIVISGISLFVVMTKMTGSGVTGYASSTGVGVTNVTVSEVTYINVTDNFIELGILEPGSTNNSENVNDFFTVQNDGSININISVYDATSPFSGTGCSATPNSCYQVHGNSSDGSIDAAYTNVPSGAGTQHLLCHDVPFADGGDECVIGVQMTIPVDEPSGTKTSTMTIVAELA